jgi:nucleotide-binding universal stress UspA family protein
MQEGEPQPLSVRILGRDRDVYLDLNGGSRIPKISERKARSVAELRAAGVGVDRVLLACDGSQASKDLYQAVLTMMDPQVPLTLVPLTGNGTEAPGRLNLFHQEQEQAKQLGRHIQVANYEGETGPEIVRLLREGQYDLVILALPPDLPQGQNLPLDEGINYILRHAHCPVFLAAPPTVPQETAD